MDTIGLYFAIQITLEDIAIQALRQGFKVSLNLVKGNSLDVEFLVENNGQYVFTRCEFVSTKSLERYKANPELLGNGQLRVIEKYSPKSALVVNFQPSTVYKILELLRELLHEYDGVLLSTKDNEFTYEAIDGLLDEDK